MGLRTSLMRITLACCFSAMRLLLVPERGKVSRVDATVGRLLPEILKFLQADKSRLHDVENVVAAQGLAQNVADARRLDDSAHATAGDDARTRAGRLEHDLARTKLRRDLMRDGAPQTRHGDQRLLGTVRRLADGIRHFTRLA